MLLADLLGFALDHPAPRRATVVLVSASDELATMTRQLQEREYVVNVVAHAKHCPQRLVRGASAFFDWEILPQAVEQIRIERQIKSEQAVKQKVKVDVEVEEEEEEEPFVVVSSSGSHRQRQKVRSKKEEDERRGEGRSQVVGADMQLKGKGKEPVKAKVEDMFVSSAGKVSVSRDGFEENDSGEASAMSPFSVKGKCKRFVWHALAQGIRPSSTAALKQELKKFFSPASEESIEEVVQMLKQLGVSTEEKTWCASSAAQFARSVPSAQESSTSAKGISASTNPNGTGTKTYRVKSYAPQKTGFAANNNNVKERAVGGASGQSSGPVPRKVYTPTMTKKRCLDFVRHGVERNIRPRSKIELNAELMKFFRPCPGETVSDVLQMLYTVGITAYGNVWNLPTAKEFLQKTGHVTNAASAKPKVYTVPARTAPSASRYSTPYPNGAVHFGGQEGALAAKKRCKRYIEHTLEEGIHPADKSDLNESLMKFFRPVPPEENVTDVKHMLVALGISGPDNIWRRDYAIKFVSNPDQEGMDAPESIGVFLDRASRVKASILKAVLVRLRYVRSKSEDLGKPWPQCRDSWTRLMDGYSWTKADGTVAWKRPSLHLTELSKTGCVVRNVDESLSWQHEMIEVLIGPSQSTRAENQPGREWENTVNKFLRVAFEKNIRPQKPAELTWFIQRFVGPLPPFKLKILQDALIFAGITGQRAWDGDAAAQLLLTRAVLCIYSDADGQAKNPPRQRDMFANNMHGYVRGSPKGSRAVANRNGHVDGRERARKSSDDGQWASIAADIGATISDDRDISGASAPTPTNARGDSRRTATQRFW